MVSKYYNDLNNIYDQTLQNKFVFHTTWSGDFYAIDLNKTNYGKVIYLSYNDAPGHNYILGNSFDEFMNSWTELGFIGPEGGDLLYFLNSQESGLNAHSENAKLLKQLINR